MAQYALFIDGAFVEKRERETRPAHIPHKNVEWYPVGAEVEGDSNGWAITNDEAIRTYVVTPPPVLQVVLKTDIWLRMSDDEAAAAQAALEGMKASAPRLYRLFSDAAEIRHDSDFFAQLQNVFVQLYGADRAAALLEAAR
jgi:hypothetical protein